MIAYTKRYRAGRHPGPASDRQALAAPRIFTLDSHGNP